MQPDVAGSGLLAGATTCQPGPTVLVLDRDVDAGETLMVAFFMREPNTATAPTITGGPATWVTDFSQATIQATNRRHLSLFRGAVSAKLTAGTQLAITHPTVESSGAVVFAIPAAVSTPEAPSTTEGTGAFSLVHTTTATSTLCAVVHHNGGSAAFDAAWTPFYDLISSCSGEARQTAGLHLAIGPGKGTVTCSGALNNDAFAWEIVALGYDGLVP